mgnify:CR=1 FL=1
MSRQEDAPVVAATATGAKDAANETTQESQEHPTAIMDDRATGRMRQARAWVEENPQAWGYMLAEAEERARDGRRFGMQELAEWARRGDFTDRHGRPTRINNNLVAPLARIVVERCPECRPYIEMRTRAYDGLTMGGGGAR